MGEVCCSFLPTTASSFRPKREGGIPGELLAGVLAKWRNLRLNTIPGISQRILLTKRFAPPREYPIHRMVRDEWGTPQLW